MQLTLEKSYTRFVALLSEGIIAIGAAYAGDSLLAGNRRPNLRRIS
jgi:hypothetical protein